METNTSSMRINRFDEQVAKIRGEANKDFRRIIEKAYNVSEVFPYFFSADREKWIREIGEWLLKLGCLHSGEQPKEGAYDEASAYLFQNAAGPYDAAPANLQGVLDDAEWVLKRVSNMGSPSRSTLPSWPPVHVLAALRSRYLGIEDPEEENAARRLIDAYYWRSLFSNRHERQANDRLTEDFEDLVKVLQADGWDPAPVRAFNDIRHPPYDASFLVENAGWIGRSRIGKALMSGVLASAPTPVDWITGNSLVATHIRDLENTRRLDRHHVFPKDVLEKAGVPVGSANNGLNGAILDRRTNRRFWKYEPVDYVAKVTSKNKIAEADLCGRIEGHLVPYGQMVAGKGTLGDRYRKFLDERAKLLAARIGELAGPPD